jgi:hypothetical protein
MKSKIYFTSEDQLVDKVLAGVTVHWMNDGYVVTGKTEENMLVMFTHNKHCTGLFNRDKILQGNLSDFYFYDDEYTVIVGNIGRVYCGECGIEAEAVFDEYVQQSKMPHGRASGESVALFLNNEPIKEYGEYTD